MNAFIQKMIDESTKKDINFNPQEREMINQIVDAVMRGDVALSRVQKFLSDSANKETFKAEFAADRKIYTIVNQVKKEVAIKKEIAEKKAAMIDLAAQASAAKVVPEVYEAPAEKAAKK